MSELPEAAYQANLQRGSMLRQHGRYAEAEKFLQTAIAQDANRPEGYYELAFCYCNWEGNSKQALAVIDRAIALAPNTGSFFALRAWILGNLDKDREAVTVANEALGLEPWNLLAFNARTRAYIGLREWKKAEDSARETLAVDAVNDTAQNFLALALRQQGRHRESEDVAAGQLAQTPDDAFAHANSGWSALQAGDYRLANSHFLESLRLQPGYEYARRGLLHAFNSRVWIYRHYFKFIAWMGRHKQGTRYFLVAVIYFGYRTIAHSLEHNFGREGEKWLLVLIMLYFTVMGFGRHFANFFLQLDRFARHALTRKEKVWSYLAVFAFTMAMAAEICLNAWPQLAVLALLPGCFLWAALTPRVEDALAAWRTSRRVRTVSGSA